jgi:nitrogen fixation protein NifU and related proteins
MDLKALYREVILDHYKNPRNSKELAEPAREGRCKNPSCGDKVTLQLGLENDRISEVGLIGNGCAISQASASMMTQAVKGKEIAEARQVLGAFREMIVARSATPDKATLGDLLSLQGVAELHARVKCAMCGWSALEAALDEHQGEVDLGQDDSMPDSNASAGS